MAKLGTLIKASEVLFVSQSALSHQLKEIEEELKFPVFIRKNRKLVLSHEGELLFEYSEKILALLEELDIKLKKNSNRSYKIRITIQAYTTYFWLLDVIKKFNKIHTDVVIDLIDEKSSQPEILLQEGKLDFALMTFKSDDLRFIFEPVVQDELVVVVSKKNPLSKLDYIDVGDITGQTLLTHSKKEERGRILEKTNPGLKINPKNYQHVGNTVTILEMIKSNLGIAILSRWAVSPYVEDLNLQLKKFSEKGTHRHWYLAYSKNKVLKPHETAFARVLKETL